MKKNTIRRILTILVLTMVTTSMVFVAPVNATMSYEDQLYEYGNHVKARYTDPDVDILLGKGAGSAWGPNTNATPDKAIDGILSMDSFWMTYPATPTSSKSITIALNGFYYFDRWVVKHLNPYNAVGVSSSYRLKIHKKFGSEWEWAIIDEVEGNTAGLTDITLDHQFITDAICIEFLEGCPSDGRVRITEIGLYNTKGYVPVRGDILTTETSFPNHSAICYTEDIAVEADGAPSNGNAEMVLTTTMDKWKTNYKQVTVLRVKDAALEMSVGAGNFAHSRIGYPYNYNLIDYRELFSFYCNALCYSSWKYNGVDSVQLDSDLLVPGIGPLTVSDLKDDDDTYVAYERSNGLASSNIVWGN